MYHGLNEEAVKVKQWQHHRDRANHTFAAFSMQRMSCFSKAYYEENLFLFLLILSKKIIERRDNFSARLSQVHSLTSLTSSSSSSLSDVVGLISLSSRSDVKGLWGKSYKTLFSHDLWPISTTMPIGIDYLHLVYDVIYDCRTFVR